MIDPRNKELIESLWPETIPDRVIKCRHCGGKNRVLLSDAVFDMDNCKCGRCKENLFLRKDQPLERIASSAYEHSLDRKSLQTLKSVPGFPALVRWFLHNISERLLTLSALSGSVQVNDKQFPELKALLDKARISLDIPYEPGLYLSGNPFMNAMTMGVEQPLIIVYSGLLDQLDDDEVTAVIAHELGHLHSDHVLYKTMARILVWLGSLKSTIVNLLTVPIQLALFKWSRCAELTADRAALLATRDLGVCLRVDLKLAGGWSTGIRTRTDLKITPFIEQARMLDEKESSSWLDNILVNAITMNRTHPFAAWRVMHLIQWVEDGNYLDIMSGNYTKVVRE